ncbi:MAG: hypothetical protein JWR01_1246 [Subtercola sp.]|nr:hypothetical protein [Subtercola sp.]
MKRYSERAYELAEELAEKAADNLRRLGKTVERNPTTGLYVVSEPTSTTARPQKRRAA